MATDTVIAPADLSKRVAALAGSRAWSLDRARELLGDGDIDAIIAAYERGLVPLAEAEGMSGGGRWSMAAEDGLAMIAIKLNPTMSAEQAGAWTKAIRVALSDLPGRVIVEAVNLALKRPIRFFPEVDGVIREEAEEINIRHQVALRRLKALRDGLARVDAPRLPPPPPMPEEELQSISPELRKIGLGAGWLKEDADGRLSWNEKEEV